MKKSKKFKNSLSHEYYTDIQKQSLAEVYEGNAVYLHRKICRWYSEKFSTKLIDVMNLPWEHVISNYYESMYESMSKKDLEEAARIAFTPDLVAAEEQENEDFAREIERKIKEKQAKNNKSESLESKDSSQSDEISLTFNDLDEEN
jgi:hypothetical protein